MASNEILAKMAVQISANSAEFGKELAKTRGQFSAFTKGISNLASTIAGSFGAFQVFNALKSAINTIADFEKELSNVKAITGATGQEFEDLKKDALDLGASTRYTAQQVAQLQVAYGRLGFTTKEILAATAATLDLAAATGEDLAKSADVAGSTVRGFGLDAKQTGRVVDVMASSFNKTALGLENFTESMKYVAPIANAAGASVEQTTALLGVLADAGIRGSSAGTALRKIFGDLTKDGRPLEERLAELGKKGITLADSYDEVGRTAQTALLVLTKNTDKTKELSLAFEKASGEAAKMARVMSDNLTGDVIKLTSAFDGLILKIGNSSFLRSFTKDLTGLLNLLAGRNDIQDLLETFAKRIPESSEAVVQEFTKMLADLRREAGKPIDVNQVEELAAKYKLTSDQANILYRSILEANRALSFQEKAIQQFKDFAAKNGYTDLNKGLDAYKQRLYELILAEQIRKKRFEDFGKSTDDFTVGEIKNANEQIAAYRRIITILNEYGETFEKVKETPPIPEKVLLTLEDYQTALKEVGEEFDRTNIKDLNKLRALAAQISGYEAIIKRLQTIKQLGDSQEFLKDPNTSNLSVAGAPQPGSLSDLEKIYERVNESAKKLAVTTKQVTTNVKTAYLDMSSAISGALSTVASGLGEALVGTGNFGDSIVKAIAGFARSIGEALIGIGVGLVAAKLALKNPYTAIAAGVALVALSAALSASVSKSQSNFNSGGGAGGIASSSTNGSIANTSSGNVQDLRVSAETIIRGQDLYVVLSNYQKNSKYTNSTNG